MYWIVNFDSLFSQFRRITYSISWDFIFEAHSGRRGSINPITCFHMLKLYFWRLLCYKLIIISPSFYCNIFKTQGIRQVNIIFLASALITFWEYSIPESGGGHMTSKSQHVSLQSQQMTTMDGKNRFLQERILSCNDGFPVKELLIPWKQTDCHNSCLSLSYGEKHGYVHIYLKGRICII